MALTRSLTRLDSPTLQTTSEGMERESLLALSQRKLNALGLPVCYIDADQRYRFVNRAFLDWTGRAQAEVIGREVVEVDGRELYQLYHAYLEAALSGERVSFERQLTSVKRNAFWIRVDYYPDRGPRGDVRGVLSTFTDVDNIKRLELEAGEREHRLRIVTDSVGLPIFYFDRALRLRFANKPYGKYIGGQVDDLLGQPLKNFLATDALAEMQSYMERAFAGATVSYDRRERSSSGELRWVRITLFPDREPGGKTGGAFVVINDIEDDIRIREALKGQEAQLRLFADNIPGPIAYLDKKLKYTFVNQAFANWVCRPQDQIYGKTPYEVMPHDVNSFLRPIIKRAQEGENVEYERVGTNAEGQRHWMHGRIAPDLDGTGKVRGLYCTEYDIHDLKLTEQALATREEQLRLFTDNIPEPVVYVDMEGNYTFVNDAFLHLVGIPREEVIGKSVKEVLGPEVFDLQQPYVDRAAKGESVTYEREHIDINGRQRWLRDSIFPDMSFDGTIKGYYIVGHDITDLQQAQNALAARESQLRAIMDGVPAPVAYLDRDERCQYVNKPFLQYFGLTAEQVGALRLRDVVGHGIYASAQAMLSRALHGESTSFDRLVPGAGGAKRWMTIRVVPDATPSGEVHGAFVLMNDIHGLKQAQEALRASEAELRLIMDNVPARVAYIDREYRYRFLNRHNEEWLSESRKELTGRPVAEVLGDARARQLQPLLTRVLAGETISTEQLLVQPNGEQRWESIHLAPNRDAESNVIGIYAAHTDIHDQKRNEEALRRANWMLSSHINNTPLAVLEWDRDFRLVRWSPQAENIFGWRAEEVLGMPISGSQLTHETDREAVVELINKLMAGDEPRATGLNRNYRKDGETIWCEWYHSCLLDEQGQTVSILSFVQDVSSRIQAEEILTDSASFWQTLSFTAAHKLGNPLFALETNLQSLKRKLPQDATPIKDTAPLRAIAEDMDLSIERAKAILTQFKSASRAQEIDPRPIDLLPIIKASSRTAVLDGCKVEIFPDMDAPWVFADPARISDCVDELFSNAMHWLKEKLPNEEIHISIDIQIVDREKDELPHGLKRGKSYVRIVFKDNGCGVPLDKKERIFAPFYTTHPQGTGLGLWMVRSALEAHGGLIRETGQFDKEAVFELFLERADPSADARTHG
jgi:PAS domain S-box-containing protein